MPGSFPLWGVATFLLTGCCAAFLGRRPDGCAGLYGATFAISAALLAFALLHLLTGAPPARHALPLGLPWVGAHFRVDALSALFLAVVNLGAAAASIFGVGYGRHEASPLRVVPFFAFFLAGMNLVVLADDAFTFLVSWEFMSLVSWALVMAHHRVPENARAGYIYIVMASFGTFALLLAFGLMAGAQGDYAFDAIRAGSIAPWAQGLVLLLALVGAGSKAGLVPLHVWLPLAHPAAPSHVSALMSGVMTKVAVYGFIRIVFDLLGPPVWWWGLLVLGIGAMTAVLGILFALMQNDLKRLLAYSTIENIGFIFVGLGLALAFRANGMADAAALALTAALFHVINHACFKSALFFGAGAVLTATGTRDIERMGGLIHLMPWTAAAFLVASVAISALPPLNGFASEWLLLQSILLSPDLPQWSLRILVPAAGGLLALAAALVAACFVRAFGIAFLGRPRSVEAAAAHETDAWSIGAMVVLAALCVVLGILPGFVVDALSATVQGLTGGQMPRQAGVEWLSIVPIGVSRSSYNPLVVFVFIALSAGLAAVAIHRLGSSALRRAPAWGCGFPDLTPSTQYTAGSFSQPIRRVFSTSVFQATETVDMPGPGDLRPAGFRVTTRDLVWDFLYAPIVRSLGFADDKLNSLQFLTILRSLTLVFFDLIALLVMIALRP